MSRNGRIQFEPTKKLLLLLCNEFSFARFACIAGCVKPLELLFVLTVGFFFPPKKFSSYVVAELKNCSAQPVELFARNVSK